MTRVTVGLSGQGLLAGAIEVALAGHASVGRVGDGGELVAGDSYAMLVHATDSWHTVPPAVREGARSRGIPWLPVHTELGHAVIGPVELPGEPGCVDCVESRRRAARADPDGYDAVRRRHRDQLARRPSGWLTGLAAKLIAALVVDQARQLTTGAGGPAGPALVKVDLDRLSVTRHPVLPDPLCRTCGQLPEDAPELARIALAARPTDPPGSYRTRSVTGAFDQLTNTYVDPEAGLVRSLNGWSEGGLIMGSAPVRLRGGHEEGGHGRSASYPTSRLTALLEALERYAGIAPGGRRTAVSASFAGVRDRAVDPRTLGLYPPQRYQLPGFRCQPFSDSLPLRWVWGYSFARREPLLVPEFYAYYGIEHPDDGPPLVYECSNGCALGSCLEEAILYGLLEVAERDAFLLTWYAQLAAPRVDLDTANDPRVRLLAATIRAETGYRIEVHDITVEQGIPCVWAMATNPHPDDGRPAVACAAGSHPDPEWAVRNALGELGPNLGMLLRRYPEQAAHARDMVADPRLVRTMADHSLLYADPGAAPRLRFLTGSGTGSGQVRTTAELGGPERLRLRGADLQDDLQEAVGRYLDTGLDVVVVDQTTPELLAGGLACAKVIVPGTLSMTFGHDYRRVDGLPRLHSVPALLGYRDRPLAPDEVNPHPHPFP